MDEDHHMKPHFWLPGCLEWMIKNDRVHSSGICIQEILWAPDITGLRPFDYWNCVMLNLPFLGCCIAQLVPFHLRFYIHFI
ncbi:hypothetical protein ACJX0J_033646, partial [Zea mays]